MAAPVHRPIYDQNLNLLYSGAAPGGKTKNVSKQDKKGGIGGGRKVLSDISNSRRPPSVHSTKKTNIISIDNHLPCEIKSKSSKVVEKGKAATGRTRKALTDLTNSVKPSSQLVSKTTGQTVSTGENFPTMADERFMHDHQKCIEAKMKAVDIDYFLETVGLNINDIQTLVPSPNKAGINKQDTEWDEIPEPQLFKTRASWHRTSYSSDSPLCQSPKSPRPPYMNWGDKLCSDLTLIESPRK